MNFFEILALANAQFEAAKPQNSPPHEPAISRDQLINNQTHRISRNLRPPPTPVAPLFNRDDNTVQEIQLPPFLLPNSPTQDVVEPLGAIHPQHRLTPLSTMETNTLPIQGLYSFKQPNCTDTDQLFPASRKMISCRSVGLLILRHYEIYPQTSVPARESISRAHGGGKSSNRSLTAPRTGSSLLRFIVNT